MLNAVIYARFSSACSVKKAQTRKSAPAKPTPKAKAMTYIDEVKSGRDITKRDSNNQMQADAFDSKFEKLGIKYEYAAQPIYALSPKGQMMETMMVGMAAYYSRNLAKKLRRV